MKQGGSRLAGMLGWGSNSQRRNLAGFTIVETMIVLAVTGVLFVSAAVLISGRQARTQFTTAINTLQQQLQQIINETASGYLPQQTAFKCTRGVSASPNLTYQSPNDHQGTNPDCIFLGKVVQFAVGNSDPEPYAILPIVGNRLDTTGGVEASTLYGATGTYPEAAVQGVGTNSSLQGADTSTYLAQGLRVVNVGYTTSAGGSGTTGAVGFITSLPSPDGGGVASGTQHMLLYAVQNTALHEAVPNVADAIYTGHLAPQPLLAVTSVSICAASGTTNQSGLITIGPNDISSTAGSLVVTLAVKSGTVC